MLSTFVTRDEFIEAYRQALALKAQIHELEFQHMKCFETLAVPVDLFLKFCRDRKLDVTVLAAPIEVWKSRKGDTLSVYEQFGITKKNPPSTTMLRDDKLQGFSRIWLRDILDGPQKMWVHSVTDNTIELGISFEKGVLTSKVRSTDDQWIFSLPLQYILDKESEYAEFMRLVTELSEFVFDAEITKNMALSMDIAMLESLVRRHPNEAQAILDSLVQRSTV